MAEESLLFKLYSKGGDGIVDSGFYADSSCFLQITGGNVVVSIGTETAEAHAGDFLFGTGPTSVNCPGGRTGSRIMCGCRRSCSSRPV